MKNYEIKEMSNDELVKRIEEEQNNLVDLRFSHQLKQLTNTAKLRNTRKDIAKMKTLLEQRLASESVNKEKVNNEGAQA